jgi:hypothetical protein
VCCAMVCGLRRHIGADGTKRLFRMCSDTSSPEAVVIFQHIVPVPSMLRPLLIPFRTLLLIGSMEIISTIVQNAARGDGIDTNWVATGRKIHNFG